MDFMTCEWGERPSRDPSLCDSEYCLVTLKVRDYPEEGISLEDIKPLIHEIRSKAKDMIIRADLAGMGLIGIERFKMIVSICQEVVEYTKDDSILRKIEIQGAGFIFRTLYGPISLAIPKYFREMIQFI
jgi:hypothetical protein